MTLHREDVIWLAGILEGEGCFDSPRGNPRLRVKMTDGDIVIRVAHLTGATLYIERAARPEHTDCTVAQTTGENAVRIMTEVLPWMGSRRSAKIAKILAAQTAKRRAKRARHLKAA